MWLLDLCGATRTGTGEATAAEAVAACALLMELFWADVKEDPVLQKSLYPVPEAVTASGPIWVVSVAPGLFSEEGPPGQG